MIGIEQIRAARGLLGWTQDELARAAKLSKPAVNNIERGIARPRTRTMQVIQSTFENAGVEFMQGGARFRGEALDIKIMEGSESIARLLRDVIDTLESRSDKRELLVSGIQEKRFVETCGDRFDKYLERMKELGLEEKLLALENDTYLVTDIGNYRWVPEAIFSQVPYFVYGDKYAIILWGPPQKIVVIENEAIAGSYRRQFYAHWAQGKRPVISKK